MSVVKALREILKTLKGKYLNQNIISYLVCIVIASILWLLNTLNQEYTVEISYPVKYINFPENKYPADKLPNELNLELKAQGFQILAYQLQTSFLPVTVNLANYSSQLKKESDIYYLTLNTNEIKDNIERQLKSDIKLLSVIPAQINFRFVGLRHKKVAIQPSIVYSLKRQYILNRLTMIPDSIVVSGPANMIDTLQFITTSSLHLENLYKNVNETVSLQAPEECSVPEASVKIFMEIEQFTEAKRTIPIKALNVPDSILVRLFPTNVIISYEVGLSKYDKISDKDFIFAVDYPRSNTNYLEVKVQKTPTGIKNLSFTPQKVEYLLERR